MSDITKQDIVRTRAQAEQVRAQWTSGDTPRIEITLDLLEQLLTAAGRGLSVARMMEIAAAHGLKWTPEDHFAMTEGLQQKITRLQKQLREAERDAREAARDAVAEAGWRERQGDEYGSY